MRKEDKLLLLSEILGVDISSLIANKENEFKASDIMYEIGTLLKENKGSKSPKYLKAQNEYKVLKEEKIVSMKQYFLCLEKALRILSILKRKEYINPLMCSSEESDMKLASLIINFDGKEIILGDFVMLETYSDIYKIEAIKYLVINWKKEVDETFVRPIQLLLTYPKNLPYKRIIPLNKLFILCYLFIVNSGIFITFFFKDKFIYPILQHEYQNLYISIPYFALLILVFIFDFCFTFFMLKRNVEHRDYFFAQRHVLINSRKVLNKIDKKTSKIYKKILKCIINKNEIKGDVRPYTIPENEIDSLEYLKEENERPLLNDDHVSNYEIVLIELITILLIYFVALFIMYKLGVIK